MGVSIKHVIGMNWPQVAFRMLILSIFEPSVPNDPGGSQKPNFEHFSGLERSTTPGSRQKRILSIWGLGRQITPEGFQKAHFEYCRALAAK